MEHFIWAQALPIKSFEMFVSKKQTFSTASSRRSASFASAAALPQLQNISTPVAQLTSFIAEFFEILALSLIIFSLNLNTDHIFAGSPALISQPKRAGGHPV